MENILYEFRFSWLDCIWWLIPVTLSCVFVTISVGIWKNRHLSFTGKIVRIFILVLTVFVVTITVVWIAISVLSYHVIKEQLRLEKYSEVIGVVEEFLPMPVSGHQKETFKIDGISFSYSTFEIKPGYHTSSSWGGVITHNGQYLKIQYIGTEEYKIITYIAELVE